MISVDFEKLQNSMTAANDTQKRAVLSSISESTDPRAKKLLETLAQDKNTAIKMLASSYLKKNFSDGAASSTQNHGSQAHPADSSAPANSNSTPVQSAGSSGIFESFSNFDFQKLLGPDFMKIFVVPLGLIIIAGLFSPIVPPFLFLAAYFALVVAVSLNYDLAVAVVLVSIICVFSMLLHAVGLIVNFRPTIYLLSLFLGSGIAISMVTTALREKLINSKAASDEFKSQISQMKKLLDKRKDFDETQRDMDQVTKMKNDLTSKSRKLNETLIQIHEIISNQKTDEIVDRVTKLLTRQLGAKSISIWVVNSKFHSVYPVGFSEKHIAPQKYSNMNIPTDEETIITKVAREGGFYTADDFKKISEYEPFSKEFDIKSEFCVSMDAGNRVIGAINCEEVSESFELNDEVKKLIKLIADVSAWALKNAGDLELSKRDLQNIKQISDKDREEKKKIRDIFDKFVSPKVIEEIMNNPASLALGGKRRAITLFFADIRGFTSMSETMADKPEMVLDVVNRFHSAMTDIVIAKGGTIDKYIGDALMSLFGAPMALSAAEDAFNAIDAAVAIRTECVKIREQLIKEGKTAVNVGIGINTGEVVVGMVGSKQMMNYTAIGDSVNTAARIEANAGAGQVLISRATYELVKARIKVKVLEPIMVKGKKEPVEILEVLEVIK